MEKLSELRRGIDHVDSIVNFKEWVSNEFRLDMPHAAMLVTIGRLYGVGSVPTHRISVDFPLEMIESLKNSSGALDDPLMFGWFKNQKLRFIDVNEIDALGQQKEWRNTLLEYGFHSMMIDGVLDRAGRRFATFQVCNPSKVKLQQTALLFSSAMPAMANAVWRLSFGKRTSTLSRTVAVGHPTLSLTPVELHIIELLAQGLSNKEIARRRGVSDSTVKTQVQRTGAKVGATRRAEIVAIALPFLSPLPPQILFDYDDDYGRT